MRRGRTVPEIAVVFVLSLTLGAASTVCAQCDETYGKAAKTFSVATGSPGELGLLKVLAEAFAKKNDASLCWKKAGTGETMALLKGKKMDMMIMVHAPAQEKAAIQEGWAIKRALIGFNEFYIVGPPDDPAGIAKAKSAAEAYTRIAEAKAKFVSRGDNSGTHKKEMDTWKRAEATPSGDWHIVTKDFMTASIRKANDVTGYFMSDSSTWVAEKKDLPNLKVLLRGDPVLIDTYHTLCQPDGATAGQKTAARFIDFVASAEGQKLIHDYGKDRYGEALYNDAAYARKFAD
jgi:tungstate transport system substrate-binding protein